jgi:hypothetical protein
MSNFRKGIAQTMWDNAHGNEYGDNLKNGNYNVEVILFIMPVHLDMVEFVLWLIRLFNVRQICEID